MNRATKATVITKILAAMDRMKSIREEDVLLRAFGLPAPEWDESRIGPTKSDVLLDADEQTLLELASHLGIPVPEGSTKLVDTGLWGASGLRVFISHVSAKKRVAKSISDALSARGIHCFVAHEDIVPSREWAIEIMRALHSCHAMLAVLSDGFRQSEWCDQEIGVALGRNIPIVPLKYQSDPHGFLGAVQAVPVLGRLVPDVVPSVVDVMMAHPATAVHASESVAQAMTTVKSAKEAEELARHLPVMSQLSKSGAHLLRDAVLRNDIVKHQAVVAGTIKDSLQRLGHDLPQPRPNVVPEDDIPF